MHKCCLEQRVRLLLFRDQGSGILTEGMHVAFYLKILRFRSSLRQLACRLWPSSYVIRLWPSSYVMDINTTTLADVASLRPAVQVQLRADERYGIVRFASPDGARAALEALNGTEVLGEGLTVSATDPAATARNTKRPRVAE